MDQEADADAAAMAQAMGFSSFGAQDQRPPKKRRYNAAADSATSAPDPATASNSTPLGQPGATTRTTTSTNADEIDLENQDDEAATPREPTLSLPPLPAGLPARPAAAPGADFAGPPSGNSVPRFQPGYSPRGQPTDPWHRGYYDDLSNENPWERLEKAMGLETKGIWVSRSSHTPLAM